MRQWLCVLTIIWGLAGFSQSKALAQVPYENVITYAEFEGHPVQFVLNRTNSCVILRVELDTGLGASWDGEKQRIIEFLKNEVIRFSSFGQRAPIGETGYLFSYRGGYFLWEPYSEFKVGRSYECLLFAQHAEIRKRIISAMGTEDWQAPYPYPYTESIPIP